MKILAIETSCDETSVAIVEANKGDNEIKLLAQNTPSSLFLHAKTGGIIPEIAARAQLEYILPTLEKTLKDAKVKSLKEDIDAVAVTYGPGLIGSLLVGVETAKSLAFALNKPLIGVNHLLGHIYANFIKTEEKHKNISFPAICLIVSGGHTDLLLLKKHKDYRLLGGTRDDAAGEALDKIGRALDLPYPGGAFIEKQAKFGNEKAFLFPKALLASNNFEFSFSGLKSHVAREITKLEPLSKQQLSDISASMQKSVMEVLIKKTLQAAIKFNAKSILLGGGVSANSYLRNNMQENISSLELPIKLYAPQSFLCTDNAAMIGAAAFFNYKETLPFKLNANPELYFD